MATSRTSNFGNKNGPYGFFFSFLFSFFLFFLSFSFIFFLFSFFYSSFHFFFFHSFQIDLERLKAHTIYSGFSPFDPTVEMFWAVMEVFFFRPNLTDNSFRPNLTFFFKDSFSCSTGSFFEICLGPFSASS